MTEKILLMSDIHITEPGVTIVGLNPALRFKRCLEHAAVHHSDASHLFIMGDLTHNGSCKEYVVLKEILSSQPFEATLMLGNHDRREPFAKTFNHLSEGFQHGKKPFGKTEIIYLDTLDERAKNEHSGLICEERLQWLEGNLQSGNGPILVLSHHHMLFSGFYGMDEIRLINGKKVSELLLTYINKSGKKLKEIVAEQDEWSKKNIGTQHYDTILDMVLRTDSIFGHHISCNSQPPL